MFFQRFGAWIIVSSVIAIGVILYAVAGPNIFRDRLPADTVCLGGKGDLEIADAHALIKNFNRTVFENDYMLKAEWDFVHKWDGQIRVDAGEISEGDKDHLALVLNQLACLTGLNIAVYESSFKRPPNFYLSLVTPERFIYEALKHEIKNEAADQTRKFSKCFSVGEDAFTRQRIVRGTAYFDKNNSAADTRRCLVLVFTKALGLFGHSKIIEKSIFRFRAPTIDYLPLNDKILVRALYDKRIKPGMAREKVMKIAAEIIPELVAAVKRDGVEALYQHQ